MPTVVTSYQSGSLDGTYVLPPILYPDGHYYLKLGHGQHYERIFETKEEVADWYRAGSGDSEAVLELSRFIADLLPGRVATAEVRDSNNHTGIAGHY